MPPKREYSQERVTPTSGQLAEWKFDMFNRVAEGACPACDHGTKSVLPEEVVALGVDAGEVIRTYRLACACGDQHIDGTGVDRQQCGAFWFVDLIISGEEARFSPSRAGDAVEAAASAATKATPLSQVRQAAEKWTTGVTTILGLFGISGIVVGKDAISGLNIWGKALLTGVVLAAVIFAILGVVNSWRAAFGWPKSKKITDNAQLLQWFSQTLDSSSAINQLRRGIAFSVAALSALLVGLGLLLFWPPAEPEGGQVKVQTTDEAIVCGELVESTSPANLKLRRDDGSVVSITATTIKSIKPATDCE